jgi:hypothetical protein
MTYKALLVGINAYPSCPLRGCINDITDMANFLIAKVGFQESDIRLLTDGRATTAAIRERLHWLVADVKPGDKIVFHYSGHGAQSATRDKAGEVDGLDEVICPVDFDWSDEKMIRDKEFHEIFASVPAGVKFIWISDSCHSGDLYRDMSMWRPRAMPVPEDIAWRMRIAAKKEMAAKKDTTENLAFISGCKSNQTSADATFNNRPNGALTYFLLQELNRKGGTTRPLTQVVAGVRKQLKANGYSQVPQLEGSEVLMNESFGG